MRYSDEAVRRHFEEEIKVGQGRGVFRSILYKLVISSSYIVAAEICPASGALKVKQLAVNGRILY
jgi:hypothetical protein